MSKRHPPQVSAPPPVPVPPGATWNNIRRAWMIPGPDGEPVLANPQPPPPRGATAGGQVVSNVPPSVKISA